MKRKLPRSNKWFTYENLNPEGLYAGDCSVRCVAKGLGVSWQEAYKELAEEGIKLSRVMSDVEVIRQVLEKHGFESKSVILKKGDKRPTMRTLLEQFPHHTIIGRCAKHVMCGTDGKVYDTWDSSTMSLYLYFIRDNNKI